MRFSNMVKINLKLQTILPSEQISIRLVKRILHQYGIKNYKKRLSYLRARFYVVEGHHFNTCVP